MAFQQGTASSPIDLTTKILAWLVTLGWTSDKSAAAGTGWECHAHKGTVYVHLRAHMNESPFVGTGGAGYGVAMYLSTAFNTANAFNLQPGNPPVGNLTTNTIGAAMCLGSAGAIQNYYFFSDAADNVAIVVEKTPGVFVHLGWGASVEKIGAWTGGMYFFGSHVGFYAGIGTNNFQGGAITSACPGAIADGNYGSANFLRIDVDGFTGKWVNCTQIITASVGYTGKIGDSSVGSTLAGGSPSPSSNVARYAFNQPTEFQRNQTSSADARANLLPVLWWVARDAGGHSMVGTLPNIFSTTGVGNGFAPASIYSLGADNYMMFPNFAIKKQ